MVSYGLETLLLSLEIEADVDGVKHHQPTFLVSAIHIITTACPDVQSSDILQGCS